jgi:hypothetical protein
MAGVSAWLGIFTFIASLLRYFRAYGAVLAGTTVSLIAFDAVEHPETILDVALVRVSAVTIGVLSAAFVSLTFHGSVGQFEMERRIGPLMGAVARLLRSELQGQDDRSPYSDQARISLDLAGMDEVIEFASAESFDISRRSTALRLGIAKLFGALLAGSHTMPMVRDAAARLPGNHAAHDLGVAALTRRSRNQKGCSMPGHRHSSRGFREQRTVGTLRRPDCGCLVMLRPGGDHRDAADGVPCRWDDEVPQGGPRAHFRLSEIRRTAA